MFELLRPIYDFNLVYAQKLVADIPDERMCVQPVPGQVMNHAAFLLGHLAWTSDTVVGLLGVQPTGAAAWKDTVGMGATPSDDRSLYPSKADLLEALADAHGRLIAALPNATPELLAQPAPERIRARFRTVGNALAGVMTAHESMHLGQLSAWRRAQGLPAVF
jgi:hypothetical protein